MSAQDNAETSDNNNKMNQVLEKHILKRKITPSELQTKEWRNSQTWYDNGKKKSETTYKDGKGDGLSTDWYENGQKSYEGNMKVGKREGLWTWWYQNGKKSEEETTKDGNGLSTG